MPDLQGSSTFVASWPDSDQLLADLKRICANRDWRLLSYPECGVTEADAAAMVEEQVCEWRKIEGTSANMATYVDRAITRIYCRVLHAAIGKENSSIQDRALIEVWNYIVPILRRRLYNQDQVLECANDALMVIWRERDRVNDPGSFLAYATMVALRLAFAVMKRESRRHALAEFAPLILERENDAGGEQRESLEPTLVLDCGSGDSEAEGPVVASLSQLYYEDLIRRCLDKKPQDDVFIATVLHGMRVGEVARKLGISVNNVSVLKSRATQKLRKCAALIRALSEAVGRDFSSAVEARHDAS